MVAAIGGEGDAAIAGEGGVDIGAGLGEDTETVACDSSRAHLLHMPPVAGLPKKPHPRVHWTGSVAWCVWSSDILEPVREKEGSFRSKEVDVKQFLDEVVNWGSFRFNPTKRWCVRLMCKSKRWMLNVTRRWKTEGLFCSWGGGR